MRAFKEDVIFEEIPIFCSSILGVLVENVRPLSPPNTHRCWISSDLLSVHTFVSKIVVVG